MRDPVAGVPFVHRMELPAGDYEITLQSDSGSVQPVHPRGAARGPVRAGRGPRAERHDGAAPGRSARASTSRVVGSARSARMTTGTPCRR